MVPVPSLQSPAARGRGLSWPLVLVVALSTGHASAAETCRFVGTTDYDGQLVIEARSTQADGAIRVDVRLQLDARPLPLIHTHYLMQEISTWRPDGLAQVAVNSRYSFNDRIIRQQWDVYDRVADGLDAYRVQGKRLADFRRHHPGFVAHWDPATFAVPWLEDYDRAAAERRPDLDLRHDMTSVRSPLALAFYWLRWLPRQGEVVPVFLPGFKEQKLAELAIGASSEAPTAGQSDWQAPLHYPGLSLSRPSIASARTSSDRHLLQLFFDLHGVDHSARGTIRQVGCIGTPPMPPHRE